MEMIWLAAVALVSAGIFAVRAAEAQLIKVEAAARKSRR